MSKQTAGGIEMSDNIKYITRGAGVVFNGRRLFFFKLLNWFDNENGNWGYGLFQIGTRHLFFVGDAGEWLFFINLGTIKKVYCYLIGHKYRVTQVFDSENRRVSCCRCKQCFAMNDSVRSILPWDAEFHNMYKSHGHKMTYLDWEKPK